jgi:putative chitinase
MATGGVMTPEQLVKIIPTLALAKAQDFMPFLTEAMQAYEINTPAREGAFISQLAHESQGLTRFVENLNYSAAGLRTTFGKYFPNNSIAATYQRQPVKIANRVYANRMGNGNEASGDGWKFRGKGGIQLTGKENHKNCGDALGADFVTNPDLLLTNEYIFKSAAWFWASRNLNALADAKNFVEITKRINGGTNGLEDRQAYYARAKKVLGF